MVGGSPKDTMSMCIRDQEAPSATYRLVDNVGLVDVNVSEVIQPIHYARGQRLVCQSWLRCKAVHSTEVIDSSLIVYFIPKKISIPGLQLITTN